MDLAFFFLVGSFLIYFNSYKKSAVLCSRSLFLLTFCLPLSLPHVLILLIIFFSLFINLYLILVHCFIVFVVTWVFMLLNMINNDLNVVIETLYYHYILPFDVILNLTWHLDFQLINDILLRNCMPVIVGGTNYYIQVGDCFILAFHGEEDKTLYRK